MSQRQKPNYVSEAQDVACRSQCAKMKKKYKFDTLGIKYLHLFHSCDTIIIHNVSSFKSICSAGFLHYKHVWQAAETNHRYVWGFEYARRSGTEHPFNGKFALKSCQRWSLLASAKGLLEFSTWNLEQHLQDWCNAQHHDTHLPTECFNTKAPVTNLWKMKYSWCQRSLGAAKN